MSDRSKAIDRASGIKLAAFDVDGVMTDGRLYFSEQGELKVFDVQDGLGLNMLQAGGIQIAIITSRKSAIVADRMSELGIDRVSQGQGDKRAVLEGYMSDLRLDPRQVAYTGDDLVDLPAMDLAGLAIAVANARPLVKNRADWITENPGGRGAVREICELLLLSQGKLEEIQDKYRL